MKAVKVECIWVDREAYAYLRNAYRAERGREPMTEDSEKRFWGLALKRSDGKTDLFDGSLGMDLSHIKSLLEDGGYKYESDTTEMIKA